MKTHTRDIVKEETNRPSKLVMQVKKNKKTKNKNESVSTQVKYWMIRR